MGYFMFTAELFLKFLVAVGEKFVNSVGVRLDCTFLKTFKKLLYGAETASVILVIIVEETGDFLGIIHHTPYIFLHVAPKLRAISCDLDQDVTSSSAAIAPPSGLSLYGPV